jgi:long-chain acyl-CoA synthetase
MENVTSKKLNDEVLTFDFLEKMSSQYPDRTAIIYLGEKYSYSELNKLTDRFAAALIDLGVRKNDTIIIYLPNCIQWLICYFAIQKVGAVPVPISPTYTSYEVDYIARDSEAKTIICQDVNYGYVKELRGTKIKNVIMVNIADILPFWKRTLGHLADKIPFGYVKREEDTYFFRELLRKHPPKRPKIEIHSEEQLAYLLYTGGTLGFPKGVPGSYKGLMVTLKELAKILEGHADPQKDVLLLVLPLYHIFGQSLFISFGLIFGCNTVLIPQPNIDAILDSIERYKVSIFIGVPALYRMILENDRLGLYNLSSLRFCWSGGDVLPKSTFYDWYDRTGTKIRQSYGSTESITMSIGTLDREYGPESVGCIAKSRQYKVVDPETLEEVPEGEQGELLVHSADMLSFYWKKPEETARTFVNLDGRIWCRTGDYVIKRCDELFYIDRSADIIKHKAFRVSATEVEAALKEHSAVLEACVTGVPDPVSGERIKGIVVLKEDVRGISAIDLIKWCRERLAPYKVPSYIEFRDILPKSKVGKTLRREIRQEERRRTGM